MSDGPFDTLTHVLVRRPPPGRTGLLSLIERENEVAPSQEQFARDWMARNPECYCLVPRETWDVLRAYEQRAADVRLEIMRYPCYPTITSAAPNPHA